jgi:hypothetical protein
VETSTDGGATWLTATSGSSIPGITVGMKLLMPLFVRQIFTTTDTVNLTATLDDLTVAIVSNFDKAILIEQGTTNLLTANQSNVETDAANFLTIANNVISSASVTLSRDTTASYAGTASLKVVCDGTVISQGFMIANSGGTRIPVAASTTYTVQMRIKGAVGVQIKIQANGVAANYTNAAFTLTGEWDLIIYKFTTSSTETAVWLGAFTATTVTTTFWYDQGQLEVKSYTTSWITGGMTRADETFTVPITGLPPTQNGTFEAWVYVNNPAIRQVTNQWPTIFIIERGYGGDGIWLYHAPNSANWTIQARDDDDIPYFATVPDSYTPIGWHHFAVTWTPTTLKLFIDGTLRTTLAVNLASSFASIMKIGYFDSATYLNSYFDEVRVSTVCRSDAEIAASATATASLVSNPDTWALIHYNSNIASEYPTEAVIIAEYNLGDNHNIAIHFYGTWTTPTGTTFEVQAIRMRDEGGVYGAWTSLTSPVFTPAPLKKYVQFKLRLATSNTSEATGVTPVLQEIIFDDWDPILAQIPPIEVLSSAIPPIVVITSQLPE